MRNSYFSYNKIYQGNKGYSSTKHKLNYDNNRIKKRLNEIKNKSGSYNIKILRPNNDNGLQRSNYFEIKKLENSLKIENDIKFKNRLKNAKTSYSIKKMKKSNKKLNNYKIFCMEILRKNRENPFKYEEMDNILN